MKFIAVFSCVLAVAFAKPSLIGAGLAGHGLVGPAIAIVPGAPIGADGRVVDTPEVTHAKIAHAAAHVNERIALNNEALRSADLIVSAHQPLIAAHGAPLAIAGAPWGASLAGPVAVAASPLAHAQIAVASAPLVHAPIAAIAHQTVALGPDGRPLDNPDVAHVKAAHAAAHINDKLRYAEEANRNLALGAHSLPLILH